MSEILTSVTPRKRAVTAKAALTNPLGLKNESTATIFAAPITLPEELVINMRWQWDNNLDSCRNALNELVVANLPELALQYLQFGQNQNPHVTQLYQDGAKALGDRFWELLCQASTWIPDFGELQTNLTWQLDNNTESLTDASMNFSAGRNVPGMYFLMDGQRHNPNVMNLYRACFAANATRLIGAVGGIVNG